MVEKSVKKTENANSLNRTEDNILFWTDSSLEDAAAGVKLDGNDREAEQFNGFYDDKWIIFENKVFVNKIIFSAKNGYKMKVRIRLVCVLYSIKCCI